MGALLNGIIICHVHLVEKGRWQLGSLKMYYVLQVPVS